MTVVRVASWDDVPRAVDDGVVLLEIDGGLPGAGATGLRRLAALDAPVVCSLAGRGDAALLAAALAAAYATAAPSLEIELAAADVLELGLSAPLVRAGAESLLFGPQPLTAERLAAHGLVDLGGDAGAAAERLAADPSARLLVRSVRAARRSTAAQAAAYDRELLALLRG